jgi:hypothetical protein
VGSSLPFVTSSFNISSKYYKKPKLLPVFLLKTLRTVSNYSKEAICLQSPQLTEHVPLDDDILSNTGRSQVAFASAFALVLYSFLCFKNRTKIRGGAR